MLEDESNKSYFLRFQHFIFFIASLDFRFYLCAALRRIIFLNDESDDDESDSGSSDTGSFTLHFDGFSGFGFGVFVPKGVDSKCDVIEFVVFATIGVDSKVC